MSAAPQLALTDGVRRPDGRGAPSPRNDNPAPSDRIEGYLSPADFDAEYWASIKELATD